MLAFFFLGVASGLARVAGEAGRVAGLMSTRGGSLLIYEKRIKLKPFWQ